MMPKTAVQLSVDGARKANFTYNPNSGALSFTSGPLGEGRHTVRVTATDPQGATTSRSWSFRVE
jgi:hypothetical protein